MKTTGLALLAASAISASALAADELTVISFGRADQAALNAAYYAPFRKATGLAIRSLSYDGETTELEQMAASGKASWDLVQVESRTLAQGCRDGLFLKLDRSRVGDVNDLIPGALSECGVGIFAWSVALAYDANKLAAAPTSWKDFWNLQAYPGKRGLRRSAKYTLEIALLSDGVPADQVYKLLATAEGVDRAFKRLDAIKPQTVWWQAAAQPAAFLAAGTIAMSSAYTLWIDREQQNKNSGLKLAWERSLYDIDSWAIPKDTPNAATAYRFIAFASRPEYQRSLSQNIAYGPANRKALALLDKDLAARLPSFEDHLKTALKIDTAFWIAHGAELEKRFDRWAP